jgi:hypothetical protein
MQRSRPTLPTKANKIEMTVAGWGNSPGFNPGEVIVVDWRNIMKQYIKMVLGREGIDCLDYKRFETDEEQQAVEELAEELLREGKRS